MNKIKKIIVFAMVIVLGIFNNAKSEANAATKIRVTSSEMRLLCAITYAEAGIEPYNGKIGVMNVIINRRNSSKSKSFRAVIYSKGQFSPVRNGALNRELRAYDRGRYKKDKSRISTVKAVKAALNGKNTVGKRKFFNTYYGQRRKNGKRIGTHIFW